MRLTNKQKMFLYVKRHGKTSGAELRIMFGNTGGVNVNLKQLVLEGKFKEEKCECNMTNFYTLKK